VGRCEVNTYLNTLNAELNPIRHLLAMAGTHHFVHVSRIRVKHFYVTVLEINISIQQFASITAEIAPAMTSEIIGFIWLCKKNIPLYTFFHLPFCYSSEGSTYTSDQFSTYTGAHTKDQLLQTYLEERKKRLKGA
jgi:hypothetical protein